MLCVNSNGWLPMQQKLLAAFVFSKSPGKHFLPIYTGITIIEKRDIEDPVSSITNHEWVVILRSMRNEIFVLKQNSKRFTI